MYILITNDLFVELVLTLVLLDVVLVALLEVLGQHNVPVLSDSVHARLLADGVDVSPRDSVRSRHVVFQVHLKKLTYWLLILL